LKISPLCSREGISRSQKPNMLLDVPALRVSF
jgi:hypothetical protein